MMCVGFFEDIVIVAQSPIKNTHSCLAIYFCKVFLDAISTFNNIFSHSRLCYSCKKVTNHLAHPNSTLPTVTLRKLLNAIIIYRSIILWERGMGASFERVFWYAGSLIISKSYLAMRSLIFQIFGTDLTTLFSTTSQTYYSLVKYIRSMLTVKF